MDLEEVEYDEGAHNKAVYAHFGLAMFCAQCLEHEVVNTLTLLELLARKATIRTRAEWEAAVDSIMDNHFEHTLGKMIKDLKQLTTVPPTLEAMLGEALRARNWLAHDYFRERATDFMTPPGREGMIDELEQPQDMFRMADRTLHATYDAVRTRYGVTDAKIQEEWERQVTDAKAGTVPRSPAPWAPAATT